MKRSLTFVLLILMVSCKYQSNPPPATDKLEAMNGLWEMTAVECGDGPSRVWEQASSQNPLNVRRQVNNGQTIDYVIDSNSCLQTSTGHIVSQGGFLFSRFGYHKYCNDKCGNRSTGCGPLNSTGLTRIQVFEEEMLVSENDNGTCGRAGQPGPLTFRYKRLSSQSHSSKTL